MNNVAVFLFFILTSLENYIVFTSAVSQESNKSTQLNHRELSSSLIMKERQEIPWTSKLQAELLHIWDTTLPSYAKHPNRIHKEWSRLHPEYSNVTADYLGKYAKSIILGGRKTDLRLNSVVSVDSYEYQQQQIRLTILNSKKKFQWTPEFKQYLIECHLASGPKEQGHADKLYRLWIRKYPQYADFDPQFLSAAAYKLFNREETQSRKGKEKIQDTGRILWDDKLEAELMEIWDQTHTHDIRSGHTRRIYKEWVRRHPEWKNLSPKYLKIHADSLIERNTALRISRGEDNERLRARMKYIERNRNRITWTSQLISDLLECWKDSANGRAECYEKWKKLHPEHANVTLNSLSKSAQRFQKMRNMPLYQSREDAMLTPADGLQLTRDSTNKSHDVNVTQTAHPNQLVASQQSALQSHLKNSHRDYGESSSQAVQFHQFIEEHTFTHQPQLLQGSSSHQDRRTDSSHGILGGLIIRKRRSAKLKESQRKTLHWKLSRESDTRKNQDNLDLNLHLK